MNQLAQVQDQCQALFVPQHGAAVRHVWRRVVEERFRIRRKGANHFVRSDPNMRVFVMVIAGQYGHDDAAGQ